MTVTSSEGLFDAEHELFRESVRGFVDAEVVPHVQRWEEQQSIDRSFWRAAAAAGLLGISAPEALGGGGSTDWRFRCVIMEELARVSASSVNVALAGLDDLVAPYLLDLGTDVQKKRWLPQLYAGEATCAIAMTEPEAGSDLRAMRTTASHKDGSWILRGAKTFITGGSSADVIVVAARTPAASAPSDRDRRRDPVTLFVLERGMPGFVQGPPFDSMGQRADTVAALHLDDVVVGEDHVLGTVGHGFAHLMERLPQERLSIAYYAQSAAESAVSWTTDFVKTRQAFGGLLSELQTVRFTMAELDTEVRVSRAFIDSCVRRLLSGRLSPQDAARAKWWTTEMLQHVVSACVQLHGGYGYMRDYPIARLFVDARVHTIYGGTSEIMKEVVGRQVLG